MSGGASAQDQAVQTTQRLDKWLWFARIVKSRTLAATLVEAGKIRVNKVKVDKPSHAVRVGDVVTATVNHRIKTLRVSGLGVRRGPSAEARLLFEDLTEPVAAPASGVLAPPVHQAAREAGSGRPTKRDRRLIARLKGELG